MLLPDNIHPELSIYYKDKQSIINLYQKIKSTNNMSFPTFILCLDWLYLIEVAQINEGGDVELCL